MMSHIVILNGSPRAGGNTSQLIDAFAAGAAQTHTITQIHAATADVHPCSGCNYCYRNAAHECARKDGMQEIYAALSAAEILVVATPVYFYGVSAQLKCIIDRLHNPVRGNFKVKKLVLLAVGADEEPAVFDSLLTAYRAVLRYFSLVDGGTVLVPGVKEPGDIAGNPALEAARDLGAGL